MRRDTPYISMFSPNAGQYGPEKTPYLDTFHSEINKSCSDTMISRKDNGIENLVHKTVFTVEVIQHVYMLYIPHLTFDGHASFLTSAEHIFLL